MAACLGFLLLLLQASRKKKEKKVGRRGLAAVVGRPLFGM